MYLDLHTHLSAKQPEPNALPPVNEIADKLATLLPGCQVTVATVNGETVGFFQGTSAIFTSEELAKRAAPQGVVVRRFNDKTASEKTLTDLFLTKTLACREASFKGFEHLTPSFMAAFAKARPNLCQLDLRKTKETYLLIQAFLEGLKEEHALAKKRISELMFTKQKQAEGADLEKIEEEIGECRARLGTVEANGIAIRVGGSDLTAPQKKELHLRYPFAALGDLEETALDLSRQGELSSESPLTFKQIAFKAKHLPKLQSIDLSGYKGCFCPFSIVALEGQRSIHIQYEAPAKLIAPKSIEVDGATRAPTYKEISGVLHRFYQEPADVDLWQVAALTPFEILYLEEEFPKMKFTSPMPSTCTLPLTDTAIIEPLCTRFPDLQIELTDTSTKQEKELFSLLDLFPTVQFLNASRVTHLLEDLDLLKSYLKRSLRKTLTTNLSDEELSQLAERSEQLRPLVSKILAYRTSNGSTSLVSLNREIDALNIKTNRPMAVQPPPHLSPALAALVKRYGNDHPNQGMAHEPFAVAASATNAASTTLPIERSGLLKLTPATAATPPARSTSLPPLFQSYELYTAVRAGKIGGVEHLLHKGADPNTEINFGERPLLIAAEMGHNKIAELLIEKGAHVDISGKNGGRPLHLAVEKGYVEIVELLLAKGADVLATNDLGIRPLSIASTKVDPKINYLLTFCFYLFPSQREKLSLNPSIINRYIESACSNQDLKEKFLEYAALRGDLEVVNLLIADKAFLSNLSSPYRNRALTNAVHNNHTEIAKLLFEQWTRLTPSMLGSGLTTAAEKGNLEIVELFLAHGADVNSRQLGESPLYFALKNGRDAVAEHLIAKGADVNDTMDKSGGAAGFTFGLKRPEKEKPLHFAVLSGNQRLVEILIAKGADTNAQGKEGRRPLYSAIEKGNEAIVKLLIEGGANVNKLSGPDNPLYQNREEERPIHLAVQQGNPKLVELLILGGADLKSINQKCQSPLYIAVAKRNVEIVKLLIDKGADVNFSGGYLSPLRLATSTGCDTIAELLIENGADISVKATDGQSLLHIAAAYCSAKVVELLLAKGAKVNAEDWNGDQPLHLAASRGIATIVKILLAHGANVNASDGRGRRPLDWAITSNNSEVVGLLQALQKNS